MGLLLTTATNLNKRIIRNKKKNFLSKKINLSRLALFSA